MRSLPRLMAISGGGARTAADGTSIVDWVGALADLGSPGDRDRCRLLIQLREPGLGDRNLYRVALQSRAGSSERLLVNGRCDLAIVAGLDGVHLPSHGIPPDSARRLLGAGSLVGVSTHRPSEIEVAKERGADYVLFGPVFDTPAKRSFGAPQGLDALADACGVGLPVFAVGGVVPSRVAETLAAGAHGVAAIRAFGSRSGALDMAAALSSALS